MQRVKIVVVGLNFGGYIMDQIADGPGHEFLELVGLCDLDAVKLAEKSAALGAKAYASLDDVLSDPTVEAVGLFTGPAGRASLIRRIIQAGKHVLTTKPFERDAAAALDVLREAQRLDKAVFMNSPSALLPADLAQVGDWQRTHDLGRPVAARFDVWSSYQETADGRWYDDPVQCPVAPIFRIGIYLINDAVRIFGEAQEVQVLSSRIRTGRPTADNAQLGILFQSGAIVNVFASFCVEDADGGRNAMTLNFERGTVYRNCGPVQSPRRSRGTEMSLVMRGPDGRTIAAQADFPHLSLHHVYQWDIFQRYVRGERDLPLTAPETVVAGIQIIEAMARAEASGGQADVLPVASLGAGIV